MKLETLEQEVDRSIFLRSRPKEFLRRWRCEENYKQRPNQAENLESRALDKSDEEPNQAFQIRTEKTDCASPMTD